MTHGFTHPNSPLGTECDSVKKAIGQLLMCFRANKLPIFFTSVEYSNASIAKTFRQKLPDLNIFELGSDWVQLDAAMDRQINEPIIKKCWASAFFGTNLALLLNDCGADSLIITGLTTSGCVRATAVDGLQHDYPVIIPREAVADRNLGAHEANLYDLGTKYAEVIPLADVLTQL